jgi:hypothetical protein
VVLGRPAPGSAPVIEHLVASACLAKDSSLLIAVIAWIIDRLIRRPPRWRGSVQMPGLSAAPEWTGDIVTHQLTASKPAAVAVAIEPVGSHESRLSRAVGQAPAPYGVPESGGSR